ncbi:hypothetical protein BLA29_006151 [Euroglyphus maynei]|uniref:Uncharacterized protein n=1 Tax=Euroglyphus maynei TaxID=6958 RepID=A0A1Y3BLB7_EURMA|nr:hypothetical protein BLA29_006151 [Euroglyphus maynei]
MSLNWHNLSKSYTNHDGQSNESDLNLSYDESMIKYFGSIKVLGEKGKKENPLLYRCDGYVIHDKIITK